MRTGTGRGLGKQVEGEKSKESLLQVNGAVFSGEATGERMTTWGIRRESGWNVVVTGEIGCLSARKVPHELSGPWSSPSPPWPKKDHHFICGTSAFISPVLTILCLCLVARSNKPDSGKLKDMCISLSLGGANQPVKCHEPSTY